MSVIMRGLGAAKFTLSFLEKLLQGHSLTKQRTNKKMKFWGQGNSGSKLTEL